VVSSPFHLLIVMQYAQALDGCIFVSSRDVTRSAATVTQTACIKKKP